MVNRRGFLKAIAATAIAVPLAPLIPKAKYATGGVISAPLARAVYRPPSVVKLGAWLPISDEMLADSVDLREWVDVRLRQALNGEFVFALDQPEGASVRVDVA